MVSTATRNVPKSVQGISVFNASYKQSIPKLESKNTVFVIDVIPQIMPGRFSI